MRKLSWINRILVVGVVGTISIIGVWYSTCIIPGYVESAMIFAGSIAMFFAAFIILIVEYEVNGDHRTKSRKD